MERDLEREVKDQIKDLIKELDPGEGVHWIELKKEYLVRPGSFSENVLEQAFGDLVHENELFERTFDTYGVVWWSMKWI